MADQENPRSVKLTYSGEDVLSIPYGLLQPPECLFGSILQVEATAVQIVATHRRIPIGKGVSLQCKSCVFESGHSEEQPELSVGYPCSVGGSEGSGFDRYYLKCGHTSCVNHEGHAG